jgi:pyruvate dehydrogenase E1 component
MKRQVDAEGVETSEWIDSLDYVLEQGTERTVRLFDKLTTHALEQGVALPFSANTPYINTIPAKDQPVYPGSAEIERRIRSLIRWNAMAMVVRANQKSEGIGGHISTYASAATLYEVAFHHFLRGRSEQHEADIVYFQGHASPGVYARAFLEGRLHESRLEHFRREITYKDGLSSYPHPWLMPDFWQYPTVSMGLSPIMAIYQARFLRYLEDRGLKQPSDQKVWAFLGDGETDEPETLGAITLASREKLDNLIFVINCNLQRLDGPVRGNGKIIQELEAIFRGAGWNVIKVIWGSGWDPLLAKDHDGLLVERMNRAVDGEFQRYTVESGAYFREHFFGTDPRLLEMVAHHSDSALRKLRWGGHDTEKVYAAYHAAVRSQGSPTVILAKTVKGYGLGEAGEGRNITHQQKKLNEEELREFRSRFGIPISDEKIADAPFYRPPEASPETTYLLERRRALGGFVPARYELAPPMAPPPRELFQEFYEGTGDRKASTTMAFVRMLSKLLRDPAIGKWIVPIVPDEARTFGMEALFRQVGIYSHVGQLYDPVDRETLLYYKEARDGQILEEGITEAGSMSSFIAAGNAHSTHGLNTIPFFIFYSMFGFQRIGDLVWAAADSRTRGFLIGGTAGRTTLAGEGLQHQDGQSHLLAYPAPNIVAYDPAFAYEIAVIVEEGIRRMYEKQESVFYYFTVMNETYPMPAMPEGARDGILRGLYRLAPPLDGRNEPRVHLLASGAILNEALLAQRLLAETFGVAADVWSVTSFKELYRDAEAVERWNRFHPGGKPRLPYVTSTLQDSPGVLVLASDYMKALPGSIARFLPRPPVVLGTDGFGRSDDRKALRSFFEVDARHIAYAGLTRLLDPDALGKALRELELDPEKTDPASA